MGDNAMLICGIDIGKNHHVASIIDQEGRLLTKSLRFANSTDGEVVVIGMEATGHYWLSLYCFLFDAGFQVNVINPERCHPQSVSA
jgi:transposase